MFTLTKARTVLRRGDSRTVRNRLKYHIKTGRLQSVARGVYAVVPQGAVAESFVPDPFLVALATRADAIFSHHSALELLGAAHSAWSICTAFTASRRVTLRLRGATVRIFPHPTALARRSMIELGTRKVERRAQMLRATGPERTLVEGFRQPDLVGGVSELVASAAGFPTLDVDLLATVLECYALRRLWAAVGWFAEAHAQSFGFSSADLARFERHRPKTPVYLARGARGGTLIARWNLVLPPDVGRGDPDAGES
ncbi:MAG: hypothetical protein KDA22_11000 [Phycisphaerales bacterium]|nr:hypothetical protein [Phycisphaerales bacterium]